MAGGLSTKRGPVVKVPEPALVGLAALIGVVAFS